MTTLPGHHKTSAAGILVFLMEELGDARLRAEQLQGYVQAGLDLVDKSAHRDHLFEVAGHLIQGVPDSLFRLGKALDAAALAAAKLDYEETKQGLKPEKVDELEAVAEGIRMRYLNRRSNEGTPDMLTTIQTAETLDHIAKETESTGQVPVGKLASLLRGLGAGRGKIASSSAAGIFRQMGEYLRTTARPERAKVVADLRAVHASLALSEEQVEAGAGEEFQKQNPGISDEEAKRIDEMHEKHKDVVKDKHAGLGVSTEDFLNDTEADMLRMAATIERMMKGLNHVRGDLTDERNPHLKDAVQKMTASMSQLDSSFGKALGDLQGLLKLLQKGDPEFWDKEARAKRAAGWKQDRNAPYPTVELSEPLNGYNGYRLSLLHNIKTNVFRASLAVFGGLDGEGATPGEALKSLQTAMGNLGKDLVAKGSSLPQDFAKTARFEQGKPADPTENMSPEDASTWKAMHDKYKDVVKDQYKAAADRRKEAAEVGIALARRGIDATYGASHGHGFWVKDRGWVDMKTAREMAGSGAVAPQAWGRHGE